MNVAVGMGSVLASLVSGNATLSTQKDNSEYALNSFIDKHGVARNSNKLRSCRFPPGHPLIGKIYRLHPLSKLPNSNKQNVYIQEESFDDVLLKEREAELVKLLTTLGATMIHIHERTEEYNATYSSSSVESTAGFVAQGSAQSTDEQLSNGINVHSRKFELVGKKWLEGQTINRDNFAWLPYEPSWEATVFSREVGGCTKVQIEIKESTSFSMDKRISADVRAKIYQVSGSHEENSNRFHTKVLLVSAEFKVPEHSSTV